MLNAAKGLRDLGHEVYFIVPKYPGTHSNEFTIRVSATSVPLSDNIRLMNPSRSVKRQIAGLNLDIIHSHTPLTAGLLARKSAAELGLPHVATFHTLIPVILDYYPLRSKAYFMPFLTALISDLLWATDLRRYQVEAEAGSSAAKRWGWRIMAAYADGVDLVITPSTYYAQRLRNLNISTPVKALSNAVDLTKFSKTESDGGKPLKLVAVGRLSAEKRQGALVEALSKIDDRLVELTFIGDGPIKTELERAVRVRGLKNVTFTGKLMPERVTRILNQSDIGLLASHGFDTQCIALIEYMASGLPIIYCDDNLKEVVGDKAALLTGPDAASIARGVTKLAADPLLRQKMSVAGLKRSRRYSIPKVALELEEIYKGLLG